jgi:hypothetical protein
MAQPVLEDRAGPPLFSRAGCRRRRICLSQAVRRGARGGWPRLPPTLSRLVDKPVYEIGSRSAENVDNPV